MIKKLIGVLATLAVLFIIGSSIVNRHKFHSMVFTGVEEPLKEEASTPEVDLLPAVDTLAVPVPTQTADVEAAEEKTSEKASSALGGNAAGQGAAAKAESEGGVSAGVDSVVMDKENRK